MSNFTATRPGLLITASPTATAQLLGSSAAAAAAASDALIDNRGNVDAFILFGDANVETSVVTGVRIPAGSMGLYGKGGATHVSTKTASGNTALVIHLGTGV